MLAFRRSCRASSWAWPAKRAAASIEPPFLLMERDPAADEWGRSVPVHRSIPDSSRLATPAPRGRGHHGASLTQLDRTTASRVVGPTPTPRWIEPQTYALRRHRSPWLKSARQAGLSWIVQLIANQLVVGFSPDVRIRETCSSLDESERRGVVGSNPARRASTTAQICHWSCLGEVRTMT